MSSYRHILDRVEEEKLRAGRTDPVQVVAVSKFQSVESMLALHNAGCRDFGESRVQEALLKIPVLPPDIRWHLVGSLQKKKVPKILGKFTLIHSVDTPELADKIAQNDEGISTAILLQVNTSGEASKHGLTAEEWQPQLERLFQHPSLSIEGLMTMAPMTQDLQLIAHCFATLRRTLEEWQRRLNHPSAFRHLSMGMSQDFPIAIQEGATLLRIGTALFQQATDH